MAQLNSSTPLAALTPCCLRVCVCDCAHACFRSKSSDVRNNSLILFFTRRAVEALVRALLKPVSFHPASLKAPHFHCEE